MRQDIDTGLPALGQPFSWAIASQGLLFTAQGPVTQAGEILQADIGGQTRLTLENLSRTLQAAGGTLDDVLQMQVYLTDAADVVAMDVVYRSFFQAPYPNRCTLVVAGLVGPGMRIEISVIARVEPPPGCSK